MILPLVVMAALLTSNSYFFEHTTGDRVLITAILRDQSLSLAAIPLFIIYAAFKFFINLYRWLALRLEPTVDRSAAKAIWNEITSSFFLSIGFGFAWFVLCLVIVALEKSALKSAVIENNFYLMELDYRIFGTYPPFIIQQYFNPLFEKLTIRSYVELPSMIVLVFFMTLFLDGTAFRKYLLNLILVILPAFLFWYLLPAMSPEEMFRRNILSVSFERLSHPEILNQLKMSAPLVEFLGRIADKWSNIEAGRLAITSIPSMHLAWGLIVCYYAIKVSPKSALFFLPYCFFNSLGTLYTLQHYAVDLFPGAILGALSIAAVDRLVNWDKRRGFPQAAYFSVIEAIQSDFGLPFRWLRNKGAKTIGENGNA